MGGKEKNKHEHKKTKGTQSRSTKVKIPAIGMCSCDDVVVVGKMGKVNKDGIQAMVDTHLDKDTTLCIDFEASKKNKTYEKNKQN